MDIFQNKDMQGDQNSDKTAKRETLCDDLPSTKRQKAMSHKSVEEMFYFDWEGMLTESMQASFEQNGFFVARDFLDSEEVDQMLKVLKHTDGIMKYSYQRPTENDKICRTKCLHPGTDVTGMVARAEKVVDTCEQLLQCEVYHWCSMFVIKYPGEGSEHIWHQDYGYWYNDGCLHPEMMTVWIALDECTRENSCKQVLKSSHKLGRINHGKDKSGQTGADEKRLEHIKAICPLVYLDRMKPGDAFIHHGNLLHCSGDNTSDVTRRAFMSCYNAAYNSPVEDTIYPQYTKIEKVPNANIKTCRNYSDFRGKEFQNTTQRDS